MSCDTGGLFDGRHGEHALGEWEQLLNLVDAVGLGPAQLSLQLLGAVGVRLLTFVGGHGQTHVKVWVEVAEQSTQHVQAVGEQLTVIYIGREEIALNLGIHTLYYYSHTQRNELCIKLNL